MNCTSGGVRRSCSGGCRGRSSSIGKRREELEQTLREAGAPTSASTGGAGATAAGGGGGRGFCGLVAEAEDDLDWSVDGPDPEEQATKQRAIIESFEPLKKLQDDSRAREEAFYFPQCLYGIRPLLLTS
jgi:hypothetical protein